jgi:quercetin dioxygenase-like cupin family protein
VIIINFGKGVRNKFHTHDYEQILIVTAGEGIVATDKEEKTVTAGDIVLIPAGENHWHGSGGDSEVSHIFAISKEAKARQLED